MKNPPQMASTDGMIGKTIPIKLTTNNRRINIHQKISKFFTPNCVYSYAAPLFTEKIL